MPSRLAYITAHFFSLPSVQDESMYATTRPAQELASSTELAAGAAPVHRSTGGPLDGSRLMVTTRRGGGAGGGSHLHAAAATGRPPSLGSSTVLTPLLQSASPTSPVTSRWPTFSVSPSSSSGGYRSLAALTRARRVHEDSNLGSPSSLVLPGPGISADAYGTEVTLPSLPTWNAESRPWLVSTGAGVTGRERAAGGAAMVGSRHTSPRIRAAGHHGSPASATGPMSPAARPSSSSRGGAAGGAPAGHDRSSRGISTGRGGQDGDGIGGRGGFHTTFANPVTTLVTDTDSDLLVPPLMHFVADEEALRYLAGLLDRRRLDEVASAVEADDHTSAEDLSLPLKGLSRAVVLQRDYVLNAQQSKLIHGLARPINGTQSTTGHRHAQASTSPPASEAAGGTMTGAAAGDDAGMSAQARDHSGAPLHDSHLRASSGKEVAAVPMKSANTGSVTTGSPVPLTAPPASSLYLATLTRPLCDPGGDGVHLSCTRDDDAAMSHQSTTPKPNGTLRRLLAAKEPGSGASAAAASSAATAALQEAESEAEGHSAAAATADAATASARPPIDVEGFCLAVRHNVFANYRTLPLHCAQRSYEQLPVRYRAGLEAISAEVLQQQHRDRQQGSTDAVSAGDEAGNGVAATCICNGGTTSIRRPCGRCTEGSSAGISAAPGAAAGYAGESYHDPVTLIGMGYGGAGGSGSALPTNMSLPGSFGATSMVATPAASSGWLSHRGSIRLGTSVFPSLPSGATEEASAAAMASPAPVATNPTTRGAAVAAAGPPVSLLPSSSPASAVTTTPATMCDPAAGTGLVCRAALLHHVQHAIQAFIARGEREVALHFIMATAPYRFSGTTDSDRVLAFFNQIRFFLPSPRFGIVLLAMEAWRSLYRPSVGAGAADCTHMTQELLALIETYLCHGRTYAEYVSGLLMLRAVLALAMENSTLCSRTAAVVLQHRSLLRGRLPTFLLAVWLILMELYTIDDTVQPPRRVLRDLAANAIQDLFTVALELHMMLPVQNVVANAVNVFFAGPQPQPQLSLSSPIATVPSGVAVSAEAGRRGGAEGSSSSLFNANTVTAVAAATHALYSNTANAVGKSVGSDMMAFPLRTLEAHAAAAVGGGAPGGGAPGAGSTPGTSPRPTLNPRKSTVPDPASSTAAAAVSSHHVPGADAASAAAAPFISADLTENSPSALRAAAATSASPAPQTPALSYRGIAKSMWVSVKRAARRLVHSTSAPSRSRVLTPSVIVRHCRVSAEAADTARAAFSDVPGESFSRSAPDFPACSAPASHLPANRHPSPPLLIEVLDDLFRESIDADSSEHAEAVARRTDSGPQQVPPSTASTSVGGRSLAHRMSAPSFQVTPRAAAAIAATGGGRGTMPTQLYALRKPGATYSPLLHSGSWAQRRHQRRGFGTAAAVTTPLGEFSSAFSDALSGDISFDGGILSRDALWTLPLACALRGAGRPQTLEATVAASTLTLGAFLCAWRIAGFADETNSDHVQSRPSRQTSETTKTTAASLGGNPLEVSIFPSSGAPLQRHFSPASGGTGSGDADPLTEGAVLPLLTPESLLAAAGSGVLAGRFEALGESVSLLCPPPRTGGTAAMPHDAGATRGIVGVSTGEPGKPVSMLATTMTALAPRTGVPRNWARFLASTATDADPEWQSVERAATNVFMPPVASVAPSILMASGAATRVARDGVPTAAASLVTDTVLLQEPSAGLPLTVTQSALPTTARSGNDCDDARVGCASPPGASRAATTAAPTPNPTFSQCISCTSGSAQGAAGLAASVTTVGRQSELPATTWTPKTESCKARVPSTVAADFSATDHSRSWMRARRHADTTLLTMAAPVPTAPSGADDSGLNEAAVAAQTPCLAFFLPSWVAARVLERCVHPCWDVTSPTALPSPLDGARAAARHTSALPVTKEAAVLLTSVVPLLSQYYVNALSASAVTAATQLLVNRAILAVRFLSQGLRDDSGRIGVDRRGGAPAEAATYSSRGTPLPSSSGPHEYDVASHHSYMRNTSNDAKSPAASLRAAAPTDPAPTTIPSTPHAPPFAAWQAEDSALVDGTELLNAVLFMTTVAERYPAVYEIVMRQKLYPLLHHTLLLRTSAVEEPQLSLSAPLSSAAAAAHFNGDARASAVQPLVLQHQQQQYNVLPVSAATAIEGEAVMQRMRLIAVRAMYQRLAMPALVLLSHNMPDDACARRCYPLVGRLAQLGLRRPFSMASVTTALCICAVYPPLSRVCQSELVRAMAVVLATPDDGLSDEGDDEAVNTAATTASGEAEEVGVRLAHRSHRGNPQIYPEEEQQGAGKEEAIGGKPAAPGRGAVAFPASLPMPAATGAASQGLLPRPSSRRAVPTTAAAAHSMWRRRLNLQSLFPFSASHLGHVHLPTASALAARRRQAAHTRLIKHHCFRVMSLLYSSWEGTTLFFLEVCLPYLRHPDAQLRLECVQCCMRWLLSNCWHSTEQTLLHHHAAMPALSAGGIAAAPSTARTPACGSVTTAVTRAPVRDPRTTANTGSNTSDGVHRVAALPCLTTLSAPAAAQAGQVCIPYHAPHRQTTEDLCGGGSSGLDDGAAAAALVPTATARDPAMRVCTVQHHGRTHVNALREVVHHLVELAVCDPEPLIRKCALESLSPETYPLLYPHEPFMHQLFTVLWDSHMPNRSKAAQLLCALAPLNPSSIFPRLRQVLVIYTDDLTSSIAQLAAPATGVNSARAALPIASPEHIHEDALFVLSLVASRLKNSTPLYLPQLLSIVSSVLRSASSPRGSVLRALHLLVALREDSTEEQSALFAPFFDIVAQQLIDGDGDTARLLATVAALQSLLQQFTGCVHSSSKTLPVVVECLHSLLYRKPSVVTEFAMAVLQLLGTISTIEPWDSDAAPRAPALLRRPQNRYALPPLSSSAGVLGRGRAARSRWLDRDERADNTADALGQLQKADRFSPFTARAWCDTVLRALMRTVSGYVNGTMSQTQGGLCTCLAAIMNILTNTVAIHHLELYMPTVLTLVIDLLEKRQMRSRKIETACRPTAAAAHKPHPSTSSTEAGRGEGSSTVGGTREVGKISDSSEAIRQLFLRSLFDLVLVAGRRIGPMYPLLNVFLSRSWKTMSPRGLVQCCEVLHALCWAVPDLLRNDCDLWVSSLLEALIHYDALVVTHRRAHEGTLGCAPPAAKASTGAAADDTGAGTAAASAEGGAGAGEAPADTLLSFPAPLSPAMPARCGSSTADPNDSRSSPLKKPHTPPSSPQNAVTVYGDDEGSWEQQLRLVYQALTLCLTSLQPLVSPLARRLVSLSLSECLKSSYVPRDEAVRRSCAPTATAAPTDSRTVQGGGLHAEQNATFATSPLSSLRSFRPSTGTHAAVPAVFDLMADPHEELISFLNACVCTPLLEYMLHSNLSTASMKLVKNLLSRLESLSAVHEEALQRLWGAMSRRSASLLPQPESSSGLSWRPDPDSGTAAWPEGGACSLAAPARAQLEAKLREVREQLHMRQAREYEEGSDPANVSGCGAGAFPSLAAFYAAPRSASEALWFQHAALSRMWVQSTDRTVTVRRYFPFDAVHTSWETEGEMQLLGCLLVSVAWHHPPSATAFASKLHTYFEQRFGPDSVAVAYVRCICSSYYDLCMPLVPAHDEEAAVKWAVQQQRQQRAATTGSGTDANSESGASLITATRSAMTPGPSLYDAAGQMTREGSADVFLRHLSSPLSQIAAIATPGGKSTDTSARGGAVLPGSPGMGSRVVSWEEDTPAFAVAGEGASVPYSAAAVAFAGVSWTRETAPRAQSNTAATSPGSVLLTTATVCGPGASDSTFVRSTTAYAGRGRRDCSSDARRSAETGTVRPFVGDDEAQGGNGRMRADAPCAYLTRNSNVGGAPHRPQISCQQPNQYQLQQQQYQLPTAPAASTPFYGSDSLPRNITAHSTSGAEALLSTTHDHIPTTATLPIPVEAGGGGSGVHGVSSFDNCADAAVHVGVSGIRSGSGSGSSFYPGSFFTSAAVVEGRTGIDGGRRSSAMNSSPHCHHPHTSLGAGGEGSPPDAESAYARGSSEPAPPTHARAGSGTGVNHTATVCRPFQFLDPQLLPGGQSHYPYPLGSGTLPSVTLGQQPVASPSVGAGMLTVGSFTAASLGHRRGLLGLTASMFSPAGGTGGGASGAAGGPGGMPPRWRFASIAASVSADDRASPNSFTIPPPAVGGACGALPPFGGASHDVATVQQQARRRLSPLVAYSSLHYYPSCGTAAAVAAAAWNRSGAGDDFGGPQLQPLPVQEAQKRKTPSPLKIEASATSATVVTGAASAVRSTTITATHPVPLSAETRFAAAPGHSPSATMCVVHDSRMSPSAEAASKGAWKEAAAAPAVSPCAAREMWEACAAAASAHEAGEVEHHNSLIAYFELHRSLSGHGWRSWWVQFCLYLLQCSPDYCIQACEPFARQHHIAFSYSELLPLALLSTLPSCTVAELVAWLRALRDFYAFHTDPRAPVPQQVASGVARMAHDLRLYRHTFFPPEVVSRVVDVWLPDNVVAELANRSLNPPLRILYLEQDLTRSFSWGCTALLMASADDVASAVERTLFVQDSRFQQWISSMVPTESEMRSRGRAASEATKSSWSSSSAIGILSPSALELLGFHRAAALEYVRAYVGHQMSEGCDGRRGAAAEGCEAAQRRPSFASGGSITRNHLSTAACGWIVGAMRCHISLYDFEAVLQLWDTVKSRGGGDTMTSMKGSSPSVTACGRASDGDRSSAVVREGAKRMTSSVLSSETARYVVMSAQALSRWDYVQEAAYYAFGRGSGGGLPWTTGASQGAQGHTYNPGESAAPHLTPRGQGPLHPPRNAQCCTEDVKGEGCSHQYPSSVFPAGTVPLWEADHTHESLLQRQMEVFVGAALVASHDYDGARRALTAVRNGLRDSYAVFHTDNNRVKLEWSSIFQQLSDLEEGMRALEEVPAVQEGMAAVSTSSEGGCINAGWPCSGSPALDREINGKLFSEVTVRRLRNIACRPVSATTTILQRFMIIAVRSAIAPVTWQLDNVLALGERLEKVGRPMRAVQVLHHYANLPLVATSFTTVAVEFKQQLNLEMLRRLIRNLSREEDLREVYACVQTVLRHDLWLARRTATQRLTSVSPSPSFMASSCAAAALLSSPLRDQCAMDAAAPGGTSLTAQELGPSLSHYQVDLLLLSVACQRRLTHVLQHCTPLARRPSTATIVSVTSAPLTAASSSNAAPLSTSETARQLTNTLAIPTDVDRRHRLGQADTVEDVKALDAEPHIPASSTVMHPLSGLPASAAPPLSARRGAASAAAAMRRAGDGASCPHNSAKGLCTDGGGASRVREGRFKSDEAATATMEAAAAKEVDALSMENLTRRTSMFAEYFLLEHVVAVTNYVPSVWREFGLVLFDVCTAIHAEWKLTEDEETKQNFLTQSAKAIHGLQLAAQLWRSRSESVFSRGIGPFPATTLRRHGHARTALPSAHLLLKALHLAVMCEAIVEDDARAVAASATAAVAVASAALAPPSVSPPPLSASTPALRSSSGGSEITKDAAAVEVAIGPEGDCCTPIPVTTPQSLLVSQRTEQPHAHTCDAETTEGTEAKTSRSSKVNNNDANTPARPSPHSTSQPQPTAAVAAAQQQQGGFACLDFSAASYVQWAAVAPFLLAAAAHHRSLYTAVRDMCVQSRDMLRQLVFPLIATFEHGYVTFFAQQASRLRCHRVAPNEEVPAAAAAAAEAVSRPLTSAFTALASEGQEEGRLPQGRGLDASPQVPGDEDGNGRANRVGCLTSSKAPSLLGQQEEPGRDASDAGLIARRAASASTMEVADRRYMERRGVADMALTTTLLRARAGISDGEATPLTGATAPYTALAQHLISPLLERPLEEAEREVHSSLLADVAAASPGHRRLIQEAMMIRGFVRGLWEVPTASPQKLKPSGPVLRSTGTDTSSTPLGVGEGAPPPTPRTHGEVAAGATPHGVASDRGAASGFVAIDNADGMHGEMELLLDGCCPFPAPLWLLPSVFGVGMTAGDSGNSGGCCTRESARGDEGVGAGNAHSGCVGTGSDVAARGRPHGGQAAGPTSPASAAPVSRMVGHRGARADDDSGRVAGLPRPCGTGLSASAATGHGQRAAHSTAASAVRFAPATVPTIMHARRYAVPHPAPHHQCEEVICVMLSDGLVCRFRHAAPEASTKAGEVCDECDAPHGVTESPSMRLGPLRKSAPASADGCAKDILTCDVHSGTGWYVLPYALMEQIASLLLSHLPLAHLQRPFVLPLTLQDYMTMLPEHGTSPLILGAATTAAVRSDNSKEWQHDMGLLTGASSSNSAAALCTATQLLARSSDATCTPPSLYHLMDDYTVHLRVREMALAAQEAVEAYPAFDLDAMQIAAETGRRCGVSADSAYPFNWAFGYPVSAPPSHEAAAALRDSHKYRNLVHRRRMNEERFNQLVAAAYDDGCVGPLIAFLQGLLAARPPPPPLWSSSSTPPSVPGVQAEVAAFSTLTSTAATTSSFSASTLAPAPQPSRPAEETFLLQQRIYAYAAVLPRTEAHLRSVLEAVLAAVAGGEDNWAKGSSAPSSSSSQLSPAAAPVLSTKRRHHSQRAACPKGHLSSVSARELQACRLALFRLESARCRLALNDAFSADSSNASHWLEARRTYANELSEWSVMEYLLDVHTRECGTVLVNTYDGHVAVHALGRYCLQPPPPQSRGACAKETAAYSANVAPLIMSPFPTHDATLFRFTPVMVAGLPLQSPHTAFQYHASSVLYEIFQYVRDLTGICTYGVDCVTAFASAVAAPNAVPSPSSHTSSPGTPLSMWASVDFPGTTSGNCGAALPGLQATLRPGDNPARASTLADPDASTKGAVPPSSAAAPRHASAKAAVAPKRRQREISPPREPLGGVPIAAAFTFSSSSFGACPAQGAALRHTVSLLKEAADPAALTPPPRCFDSSSIRLKLTYDALLVLHDDAGQSGRATILRLLRSQREATQAQWLRMPLASPSQDGPESNTKAEAPAAGHSAVDDQASRTPTPPAFDTGDSNGNDGDSVPRWASAIDLVASMITAATNEEHLLGVDGVYPHLWQRWAPHW